MSFMGIFVRLRAYFDLQSNPLKQVNLKIRVNLYIVKQRKLNIYALFYWIDTIQSKLTYILFYSILHYKSFCK